MNAPIYDLVVGNVHGARGQEDPDTSWEVLTDEEITEHETSFESQDVAPAITSHEKTGGTVTRLQSKNKTLRPMNVTKTKIVNLTSTEFKKLQDTDKRLDKVIKRIESESVQRPRQWGTEVYYVDPNNGLMHRQFTSPSEKGSVVNRQLVFPHYLCESVLEVAHDSIIGGHLPTKKTYDRVTSNFALPGAYDDVTRYCHSCYICQKTIPKSRCDNTPFVTIPIIGEPFDPEKTNMVEGDTELTNTSDSGLGAVLLQEYYGVNMPVMYNRYISRKLNGAETRYSTIER